MVSASVGNWIGGYLPTWVAGRLEVEPVSSQAYAGSILVVAIALAVGIIPLLLIKMPRIEHAERTVFAPISYATKNPKKLTKLVLPMLITSIGAGLIMPFMNVFFRVQYNQSDQVIGVLFAWGSLAMGLGLLAAPPLADRFGKIQVVVITQGLSIPFLILLGFSPLFWVSAFAYYIRVALMNMSSPVYQTFVMEQVDTFLQGNGCQPGKYVVELRVGDQPDNQWDSSSTLWIWTTISGDDHPLYHLCFPVLVLLVAERWCERMSI